jgi:alpha-L-glutamate ligase-like protein
MRWLGWLRRWRSLVRLGVLGMNRRNAECILDLNPRRAYPAVDSKSKMRDLCRGIGVPTPAIYARIAAHSALRHLPRLLAAHDDFVIKPDRGAGGRGILVVVGRQGDAFVRHNGELLDAPAVRQQVSSVVSGLFSLGGNPDAALIQQRVLPHPVFERISFQGIPDVRIILYRRVPAMAMLRLPTRLSGGRANLHQGGIGAGIDLETGRTSRAVCRNRTTDRHPDTGESLVGFQVPFWPEVLDMAVRVAGAVELGYLGVDIVIDRDQGPLLLEANARPGLAIQIANGRGLLPRLQEIDESLVEIARGLAEARRRREILPPSPVGQAYQPDTTVRQAGKPDLRETEENCNPTPRGP